MFLGHPILDEIRQGRPLRSTKTIDKSKPILVAEGETFCKDLSRANQYVNEPVQQPPIPLSKPPPLPTTPPPPPPPPPSSTLPLIKSGPTKAVTNPALLKLGGKQNIDRDELMRSIKSGVRLKKATTVDKSAPIIRADIEAANELPPVQHQKCNSYTSSASSECEYRDAECNANYDQSSSAAESLTSLYTPSTQTSNNSIYTPQYNTLPRAQSQQPNKPSSGECYATNNGTMPRAKKADERYTSPIPTREMIEAEIPTGSAANKIKLLNSLHSRTQSQSPIRMLNRPTVSRSRQLQNGLSSKFATPQVNEEKADVRSDENLAPPSEVPNPPVVNAVSKSSSMNSIKKMAQKFDSNVVAAQQPFQPRRFWRSSSTSNSLATSLPNKFIPTVNVAEKEETPETKPVSSALKLHNETSKEFSGFKAPLVCNGTVQAQVKKAESTEEKPKSDNSNVVPKVVYPRNNESRQFSIKPYESNVASSSSAIKDEEKHPRLVVADSWRREPEKYHPAVATTSFDQQMKKLSCENLRSAPMVSPGSRSVTNEKTNEKLDFMKKQKSFSSENIPQYSYEQIQFKPPLTSSRTSSKSSLFKYIVPIEIDTDNNPPPVPTTLPPKLSPVNQSNVQRSIVNRNGNSREQIYGSESETSAPKFFGSTSLASSYSAPSSRSYNSSEISPNSQHSPLNVVTQPESSPNSSTSLSPLPSQSRPYNNDSYRSAERIFNGNGVHQTTSDSNSRTLLQPAPNVFAPKKYAFSGPGMRSASPTELERTNANTRWNANTTSRSTPQLDCDSDRANNGNYYSVPINAPWYDKRLFDDAIERMNNGYGRRTTGSRSSEEIYQNADPMVGIGRARKIIVGVNGPNIEAFSNMDPETFRDNFKFAINLNSDNLLSVIPR